jgi:hypothetical protein
VITAFLCDEDDMLIGLVDFEHDPEQRLIDIGEACPHCATELTEDPYQQDCLFCGRSIHEKP